MKTYCRLTSNGLYHYPRRAEQRKHAIGEIICQLPHGSFAVEWPWGIAFNTPAEISILQESV